jgi:hypothetical protein
MVKSQGFLNERRSDPLTKNARRFCGGFLNEYVVWDFCREN